ncbi:MAG: hypothetical protein JEY94_05535 [Melioribacteraceae bacterium]|nr:hypothetical protein [Melioribacteraceae bacterium]
MSAWIKHEKFQIHHINPSWFIPVVGSIMPVLSILMPNSLDSSSVLDFSGGLS